MYIFNFTESIFRFGTFKTIPYRNGRKVITNTYIYIVYSFSSKPYTIHSCLRRLQKESLNLSVHSLNIKKTYKKENEIKYYYHYRIPFKKI